MPLDGQSDPAGDYANQDELKDLLHWAMRADVPRMVAASAGTGNDLDARGAVIACDGSTAMGVRSMSACFASSGPTESDLCSGQARGSPRR